MSVRPVPGVPIEGQNDAVLLRACLYGEARGESPLGRAAVGCVILNRAKKSGVSVKEVILKPFQFSSFNDNDPNRAKLLSAWQDDPGAWARCDETAALLEAGAIADPTLGATHYHTKQVSPAWGHGSPGWHETAVIGNHYFGRTA